MFSESKRVYPQWRERVHMVARLTKISNTFSRYFRIAQVGSSVSGITSLYIRQPRLCSSVARLNIVVAYMLCSIHYCFRNLAHFYYILNGVLIFKLSEVHFCTRATISIQGQLYRFSYRQISVTIHRQIYIRAVNRLKYLFAINRMIVMS